MEENTREAAAWLPKDKADLLARIQREWSALMQTIEALTAEQMTIPGTGSWSVKDNLAHLAAWEQFMLRCHLQGEPPHETLHIDKATFEGLDEDGENAILYERDKDRPAADVVDGLKRSHEQITAALELIPFADLMKPHYADDPEQRPLISWVIGNTYDHYQEHRRAIEAIVGMKPF
jgi:hypothetical protein